MKTAQLFNQIHPDRPPICQKVASRLETKFMEFGHVRHLPKSGRPIRDENEILGVLLSLEGNPCTPLSQVGANVRMSNSSFTD